MMPRMKIWKQLTSLTLFSILLAVVLPAQRMGSNAPRASDPGSLPAKIRRFSPTGLTANTSRLTPRDRLALGKIIAAAKLLDPLFLRQVWSGNDALKKKLEADKTVTGRMLLHYFLINDGPWSRLDENQPFIDDVPAKPPQANYYPDDMTKDEFTSWLNGLSAEEKEKATGYFYTIRRDANGKLKTVSYSQEYHEFLD